MDQTGFILIAFLCILNVDAITLPTKTDITNNLSQAINEKLNFQVITGYLPIDWYYPKNTTTGIFYELVTKVGETLDNISPDTTLVLWFNGGPGSSSQIGSLAELGPFYIDDQLNIQKRAYSWNSEAMLLFIDQPLGVGLSYTESQTMVNNTETAGDHIMNFLSNFYSLYPTLRKNQILFTGESFGGHYVPTFASQFIMNTNFSDIICKGVGVGNIWIIPQWQSQNYDSFFYSIGIASQTRRREVVQLQKQAFTAGQTGDYVTGAHLADIMTGDVAGYGNIDIYNFASYNPFPNSFNLWLNNDTNQDLYGIPRTIKFETTYGPIYEAFLYDSYRSYREKIEFLLANGVNVTVYNGQNDLNCNTVSQLKWIEGMNWNNLNYWRDKQQQIWCNSDTGIVAGTFQKALNFNFVVIYDAGHLVPTDQPLNALQMFRKILNNSWNNCSSF